MKQAQLTDKLPVIVVTSRDSSDDEVRAFDLGAVDIVAKPFEPHVVSRRVHNLSLIHISDEMFCKTPWNQRC